jgi:hypothetical protein
VKLLPAYVEVWQERECVARHERSFARYEQVLDLEHYLDVLERKPGALAGSSPLKQWRERGRWPESFDRLWQSLRVDSLIRISLWSAICWGRAGFASCMPWPKV